jgi:hypothetical protein
MDRTSTDVAELGRKTLRRRRAESTSMEASKTTATVYAGKERPFAWDGLSNERAPALSHDRVGKKQVATTRGHVQAERP